MTVSLLLAPPQVLVSGGENNTVRSTTAQMCVRVPLTFQGMGWGGMGWGGMRWGGGTEGEGGSSFFSFNSPQRHPHVVLSPIQCPSPLYSYDTPTRLFSFAQNSLQVAREKHTMTLLQDGRVLVVGGRTTGNAFLATTELYQ